MFDSITTCLLRRNIIEKEISCYFCNKQFKRAVQYINRNFKRKHNNYCSKKCEYSSLQIKKNDEYTVFRRILNKIKNDAVKRKINVGITEHDIKKLWDKTGGVCQFTGIKLVIASTVYEFKHGGSTASIDRKDSSKGYTLDNIWFVHKRINDMKGTLSVDEFTDWCNQVSKHSSKSD